MRLPSDSSVEGPVDVPAGLEAPPQSPVRPDRTDRVVLGAEVEHPVLVFEGTAVDPELARPGALDGERAAHGAVRAEPYDPRHGAVRAGEDVAVRARESAPRTKPPTGVRHTMCPRASSLTTSPASVPT